MSPSITVAQVKAIAGSSARAEPNAVAKAGLVTKNPSRGRALARIDR